MTRFGIHLESQLSTSIMTERQPLLKEAALMLGCQEVLGTIEGQKDYHRRMKEKDSEKKRLKKAEKRRLKSLGKPALLNKN